VRDGDTGGLAEKILVPATIAGMACADHGHLLTRDMLGFSLIGHAMVMMSRRMGLRMVFPMVLVRTLVVMPKGMRMFPDVDGRRVTMMFPIIKALLCLTLCDSWQILHSSILLSVTSSCLMMCQ